MFSNDHENIITNDDTQTIQDVYMCLSPTVINYNISTGIVDDNNVEYIQNNDISVKRKQKLQVKTLRNIKKKCDMDEYRFKVLELEQKKKIKIFRTRII